jgi:D-alanine transaminase
MPRIAYVNGRYVPFAEASVHVEDRGYQFADAVYEVCAVREGRLEDEEGHLARLGRSLAALRIRLPMSEAALRLVLREVVRRNRLRYGLVYIQVSRGVAPRDHAFPADPVPPGIVVTGRRIDPGKYDEAAERGLRVALVPDERWARCDIKSVSLLANVLAMAKARDAGADDAWLVDDGGRITEGTRANAWIVTGDGALVTRHLGPEILAGITRDELLKLAQTRQIRVEERAFTTDEAKAAQEAFMTSATQAVGPVVEIDGAKIGDGKPGPIAGLLRAAYLERISQ